MPSLACLRGAMEIPIGLVNVEEVKRNLEIEFTPMGADEPLQLHAYELTPTHIHVPRQFGINLCRAQAIQYEDRTSQGGLVTFPRVPVPRDYQVAALDDLESTFQSYYDFIFRARTGWGKTIGALILSARLGVSTVVLVDQENLKDQWVETLTKHFGFAAGDIGIIQGKKCDYQGKAVTIAMVQTLTRKEHPQELYDAFGLVIVDEVHIIGAPTFSSCLLKFSAMYRLGVSATPRRRDTLQKVLDYSLGKVRLWIEDEHEESAVYVATHPSVYSEYANRAPKIGRFITEVTDDGSRNLLIAEAAAYLYDTGRDILVLSDRIEQLNDLCNLCYYLGIPEEDLGVYTGSTLHYAWGKEATPVRRPLGLVKYEGDVESGAGYYYTPVSLNLSSKKAKKKDLENTKTKARIIFATYGKFSKGVDEPRLSGGVDASPRSRSEQEQGRILRKKDGKLKPVWVTIEDQASYRSVFALAGRLNDYIKNNSVVSRWSLEEGKVRCNAKEIQSEAYARVKALKAQSTRIVKTSDGLSTLKILGTRTPPGRERESATKARPAARPVLRRAGSPRAYSPAGR